MALKQTDNQRITILNKPKREHLGDKSGTFLRQTGSIFCPVTTTRELVKICNN